MWFDEIPNMRSWAALWHGYIRCGRCPGIRKSNQPCPACGAEPARAVPYTVRVDDGSELTVMPAAMGGEERYEDWVYLMMLEREWKRPLTPGDGFSEIAERHRPAARAVIVLIFWTYFETRIDRLFREALSRFPRGVGDDLLRRYSGLGVRLDRLYKITFGATYWSDLSDLGFERLSALLQDVQRRRNDFVHGHPEAIDDALVANLIASLKEEHEAWIAVFNKHAFTGSRVAN